MQHDNEIFIKLKEAELEARHSNARYSHDEVFSHIRQRIRKDKDE
jgi:hypothetical protein